MIFGAECKHSAMAGAPPWQVREGMGHPQGQPWGACSATFPFANAQGIRPLKYPMNVWFVGKGKEPPTNPGWVEPRTTAQAQ